MERNGTDVVDGNDFEDIAFREHGHRRCIGDCFVDEYLFELSFDADDAARKSLLLRLDFDVCTAECLEK